MMKIKLKHILNTIILLIIIAFLVSMLVVHEFMKTKSVIA